MNERRMRYADAFYEIAKDLLTYELDIVESVTKRIRGKNGARHKSLLIEVGGSVRGIVADVWEYCHEMRKGSCDWNKDMVPVRSKRPLTHPKVIENMAINED